jgi:hypothetical protein
VWPKQQRRRRVVLTIRIPIHFERRSGRKLIIAPDGSPAAAAEPERDDA